MAEENSDKGNTALIELLEAFLTPHQVVEAIQEQMRLSVARIEAALVQKGLKHDTDGWLDSKAAAQYMGNVSRTTFDKYRYCTQPKLKGYPLDGKVLYKKSDIDAFVRLYAVKAHGLA